MLYNTIVWGLVLQTIISIKDNFTSDYILMEKQSMEIKRNILLNPGPATTTDTVKLAQVLPSFI